jgi:hypothetical protein
MLVKLTPGDLLLPHDRGYFCQCISVFKINKFFLAKLNFTILSLIYIKALKCEDDKIIIAL